MRPHNPAPRRRHQPWNAAIHPAQGGHLSHLAMEEQGHALPCIRV